MEKIKLDIVSDNFDQYFAKVVSEMSSDQRGEVPADLITRVLNNKGRTKTEKKLGLVGFLAKMFILAKGMKKRIFIFVEGNESEGAMNIKDFVNYRTNEKENNYGEGPAMELVTHAHFVIGTKELIDGVSYLNMVSSGPAYNYLTKLKNSKRGAISEWQRQREFVVRFIMNYEVNKKKWMNQFNLSMSEMLVLLYMYSGNDVTGSEMYNDALAHAPYASGADIRRALSSLRHRKYLIKHGLTKGARFRITPLGRLMVDDILNKYGYNK